MSRAEAQQALESELRAVLEASDQRQQELALVLFEQIGDIQSLIAAVADFGGKLHEVQGVQHEIQSMLEAVLETDAEGANAQDATASRSDRERDVVQRPAVIASPTVVVPGVATTGSAAPGEPPWHAGERVRIGRCTYLLGDDLLDEWVDSSDAVTRRQARAIHLRHKASHGRQCGTRHVWVRQVVRSNAALDSTSTAPARALVDEAKLLRSLGPAHGLPCLADLVREGSVTSLVLVWPVRARHGTAGETLATVYGLEDDSRQPPCDTWQLHRLCHGLGEICDALALLHSRDQAHGELTPTGLVTAEDDRLVLRDLGAASMVVRRKQSSIYEPPEQRRGRSRRPRPPGDVYLLGAIAYHAMTGRPPAISHPVPVQHAAKAEIPRELARTIDGALSNDPADRPDIRNLGDLIRFSSKPPNRST